MPPTTSAPAPTTTTAIGGFPAPTTPLAPVTPAAVPPPTPTSTVNSSLTTPTSAPIPVPATPTSNPAQNTLGASLAAFQARLSSLADDISDKNSPDYQAPAPAAGATGGGSLTDILSKMLGLNDQIAGEGAETDRINGSLGVDQKTQKVTDLENEYSSRSQYYDNLIKTAQTQNPEGKDATAIQAETDQLTQQKNSELADIAIQQSAASGDLKTAQDLATAKVTAEFQPIQAQIDNLKSYYSLAANDMTDSEKLDAQAAITAKQNAADQEAQRQLALYTEQIKVQYEGGGNGVDSDVIKQNALQDAADKQTQNSNYQTILAIMDKVNKTPTTFTATDAAKLSNADQITIGKALARMQNPDISRAGGDAGNALSAVGLPAQVGEGINQFLSGRQYDPGKIVNAVQTATALYNQRNGITTNTGDTTNAGGPTAGTDGTAYGFPGYHSDGTQWVPN